MNQDEVNLWSKSLLLKIHVITGWTIPASDLLIILIDQFQKKLVENYSNINIEEIEFAFRNSGTTVKDWGKAMNLSLIDEVLIPYINQRVRLSIELEERMAVPAEQIIYSEENNRNWQRKMTEEAFQRLLSGNMDYLPKVLMTEILTYDGLLKGQLDDFLVNALNSGVKNLYKKC